MTGSQHVLPFQMIIALFTFRSHLGMEVFYTEIVYPVFFVRQFYINLTVCAQSVLIAKQLPLYLTITVSAAVMKLFPGIMRITLFIASQQFRFIRTLLHPFHTLRHPSPENEYL